MMPANAKPNLPGGYKPVPVRTTYLEMKRRPLSEPVAAPPGCTVERWHNPGSAEYRELFGAVGGEWGWSGRMILKDAELKAILGAGTTEVCRMRCRGRIAGFAELDRGVPGRVEIAYFGLVPSFIGQGLGKFLLDWTVRRAWEGGTGRVWLHTCEYDHPRALAAYLRAGFTVYDEKVETQIYPEEFLARRAAAYG